MSSQASQAKTSEQKKGTKENKVSPNKSKNEKKQTRPGADSVHAIPGKTKRPYSEVAESSAEELAIMNHQIDEMNNDMREMGENLKTLVDKTNEIMTKKDMEVFIKATVSNIMIELNKNIEMTIDIQVREKTNRLSKKIDQLQEENKDLKIKMQRINTVKEQLHTVQKTSNEALAKANYNEQYSRKNNVKVLNVIQKPRESDDSLRMEIKDMFAKQGVLLDSASVVAMHRIPGKPGNPKPVLVKLRNNSDKIQIMKVRSAMKASGNQLKDDVTKLNSMLISRISSHESMNSAWYFNGSVYGETKYNKRFKFDINDDIDAVIK